MAHYFLPKIELNADPPINPDTNVTLSFGAKGLMKAGFNIPVVITDVPLDKGGTSYTSKLVLAHLDTGASLTTIDEKLAKELGLIPIGTSLIHTAAGPKDVKCYAVSITFPNTNLKGYRLNVNDCILPYDNTKSSLDPQNFALLVGRDIMAHWNIVWNGPSSTVIISD